MPGGGVLNRLLDSNEVAATPASRRYEPAHFRATHAISGLPASKGCGQRKAPSPGENLTRPIKAAEIGAETLDVAATAGRIVSDNWLSVPADRPSF